MLGDLIALGIALVWGLFIRWFFKFLRKKETEKKEREALGLPPEKIG